jgi:hypothetical protein
LPVLPAYEFKYSATYGERCALEGEMFRLGASELLFLALTLLCAYLHSGMFFFWLALTLYCAYIPKKDRLPDRLAYALARRRRR